MMSIFNCGRTKMSEIMHSKDKPPVVHIGGEYYSTEKQMKALGYKKTITRYNKQEESDGELYFYIKKI